MVYCQEREFGSQLPSFDSLLALHYIHEKTRKTRLQCPHL